MPAVPSHALALTFQALRFFAADVNLDNVMQRRFDVITELNI